jgi:hypothetical protein
VPNATTVSPIVVGDTPILTARLSAPLTAKSAPLIRRRRPTKNMTRGRRIVDHSCYMRGNKAFLKED